MLVSGQVGPLQRSRLLLGAGLQAISSKVDYIAGSVMPQERVFASPGFQAFQFSGKRASRGNSAAAAGRRKGLRLDGRVHCYPGFCEHAAVQGIYAYIPLRRLASFVRLFVSAMMCIIELFSQICTMILARELRMR